MRHKRWLEYSAYSWLDLLLTKLKECDTESDFRELQKEAYEELEEARKNSCEEVIMRKKATYKTIVKISELNTSKKTTDMMCEWFAKGLRGKK